MSSLRLYPEQVFGTPDAGSACGLYGRFLCPLPSIPAKCAWRVNGEENINTNHVLCNERVESSNCAQWSEAQSRVHSMLYICSLFSEDQREKKWGVWGNWRISRFPSNATPIQFQNDKSTMNHARSCEPCSCHTLHIIDGNRLGKVPGESMSLQGCFRFDAITNITVLRQCILSPIPDGDRLGHARPLAWPARTS